MEILDQIIQFIQTNLEASASIVAVVVEFILRLIPTEKPKSLLYALVGILKIAGAFALKVSAVCDAAAKFLDKVLPQKIAPAKK